MGRFAGRNRIVGKTVAEVLERELASCGDCAGRGNRIGPIAEQHGDFGARLEIALVIHPQRPAGFVQRGLEPDTGEHVEHGALGPGVTHVVGGDGGNSHRGGEREQLAIKPLLVRIEMALEVDKDIFGAEDRAEAIA